jgi:CTP synthase
MEKEKLDKVVLAKLKLPTSTVANLDKWKDFLFRLKHPKYEVNIALVGKYVELQDAYKSILEAFIHAGAENECKVNVSYIHSELLDAANVERKIKDFDGVLIAPGFGNRGIEGKIETIKYIRENHIPFFGICLGMQCAVIEFARNVANIPDAHSSEMVPTKNPVIDLMEGQKGVLIKGGTMRLGSYKCDLLKGSKAAQAYDKKHISERHRHRYEFNNKYLEVLKEKGLTISGTNPESGLVEIIEIADHPWFVGSQFHPELKSTVEKPHPLFVKFIKAAITHQQEKLNNIS